jgi:hypothetical protein
MGAHLEARAAEIKRRNGRLRVARQHFSNSFNALWIENRSRSFKRRQGRGRSMLHLIAILFFAGLLAGLATLLHMTVREHWADMVAALFGRPLPSRAVVRPAAKVSVRRTRRAAA